MTFTPQKSFAQMRSISFSEVILCLVGARSVPSVKREILKIKEPPPGKGIVLPESLKLFFPHTSAFMLLGSLTYSLAVCSYYSHDFVVSLISECVSTAVGDASMLHCFFSYLLTTLLLVSALSQAHLIHTPLLVLSSIDAVLTLCVSVSSVFWAPAGN